MRKVILSMSHKINNHKKVRRARVKRSLQSVISNTVLPTFILLSVVCGSFLIYKENSDIIGSFFNISQREDKQTNLEIGFTPKEREKILVLVNLKNPIDDYYNYDLVFYNKKIQIDKLLVDDLDKMIKSAGQEGITLNLKNGYISKQSQDSLYQNEINKLSSEKGLSYVRASAEAEKIVPPGGKSEFQTGLTVEFTFANNMPISDILQTSEYKWLNKNCVDYGFVVRYPKSKEPETAMTFSGSIYRYVGIENSKKMRALNLCLEEYYEYVNLQKN